MSIADRAADWREVRVETIGPCVVITMSRPDRLNALTATLVEELSELVRLVDLDRETRAVVLTGSGRGFCAGIDLHDPGTPPGADEVQPWTRAFIRQDHIATLNERIHRSRKPWIAAVNGPCVGGGLALALACDIRIASPTARFAAVFTKVGLSNCDMGVSYFLPRLVGAGRAAELLLTARFVDAPEAERIGLITAIVDEGALLEHARQIAEQIAETPPFGAWMTKETMWQNLDARSLRDALDIENRTQIMLMATGDFERAVEAFKARSTPAWGPL